MKTSRGSVLESAGSMGVATFLSRIMGLIREQVFAFLFGAGLGTDAFLVAFRIPNLLRDLFAEGAMSSALVPIFTQTRLQEGDLKAWRIAGLILRVLFFVVLMLASVAFLWAPQLVEFYAGNFHQVSDKFELTVRMTRWMLPFFPCITLAAGLMAILNACGVFFVPAFAPVLFNLFSILVGVGCVYGWSHSIEGMAVGVLAGGLIQVLWQLPALYRTGYRFRARLAQEPRWFMEPRLRQMLKMLLPGILGLAATQINILVNTILATSEGTGAVSWLNYAFRLMQFPIGIFGVSFAAALLPQVSRQWAEGSPALVSQTIMHTLKMTCAVNLPAAAGFIFLGNEIIEVIFQYGRFGVADTTATAKALAMYAVGLVAYAGVKVLVSASYALHYARVPVFSSLISIGLTILLNKSMVHAYGYWGLALGTSLGALVNALFLLVFIKKMIQKTGEDFLLVQFFKSFFSYFLISVVMGGLCWVSNQGLVFLMRDWVGVERSIALIFKLMVILMEGLIWMILASRFFHLTEFNEIVTSIMRRCQRFRA